MKEAGIARLEDDSSVDLVSKSRVGTMTHFLPKLGLSSEDELSALTRSINDGLSNWETQIIVDLINVNYVTSQTLVTLLDLQKRLSRSGGWLKVTNANSTICEVFHVTDVDTYIENVDHRDNKDKTSFIKPEASGENLRIGDLLLKKGLISAQKLEEAIALQKKTRQRLGNILVKKGWVSEEVFLQTLSEQLTIPYVVIRPGLYDSEIFESLDREVLSRLKMIPMFLVHGELTLATSSPQAMASFGEIEEKLSCKVKPILARSSDIVKTLGDASSENIFDAELLEGVAEDFEFVEGVGEEDYAGIDEIAGGSPVINMVNSIIQRAVHDKASDIHIEPSQGKSRVRFRIDGLLYEVMTPRIELHPALVSRLKVMANLDIAERRMPQDGRIQVFTGGRAVDLRFSSLPGLYGEKVVLRVLDKNQSILNVEKLGMHDHNLTSFKRLLDRSYGLILVTGPTGSGKTTSLYSGINYLSSIEKNIVTIEDPVEYQLDLVNQNPVRENIGLSFAKMLKHVLRQDPDIVMVGEIREKETAEIAVQAALTGHLVLSTLHTNDSIGAVTRMIDMGVEPYLLSSALIGVAAQRLVRSICPNCKTDYLASPELIERYSWQDRGSVRLSKGRGCTECYDSGFKGRLGIHEVIETNSELQRLIISNASRDELTDYMEQVKIQTLFDDGMERVIEGKTTIEEIWRVVNS